MHKEMGASSVAPRLHACNIRTVLNRLRTCVHVARSRRTLGLANQARKQCGQRSPWARVRHNGSRRRPADPSALQERFERSVRWSARGGAAATAPTPAAAANVRRQHRTRARARRRTSSSEPHLPAEGLHRVITGTNRVAPYGAALPLCLRPPRGSGCQRDAGADEHRLHSRSSLGPVWRPRCIVVAHLSHTRHRLRRIAPRAVTRHTR